MTDSQVSSLSIMDYAVKKQEKTTSLGNEGRKIIFSKNNLMNRIILFRKFLHQISLLKYKGW